MVFDAGFEGCVPRVVDDVEFGVRPCPVQIPGAADWAHHVVAALHDDARDVRDASDVAQQLTVVEEAVVDEVVVLDGREGEIESGAVAIVVDRFRPGQ